MVDVEVVARPIAESSHVALEDGNILFVDNDFHRFASQPGGVLVNGVQMICHDPELDAFLKTEPKEDAEFVRSAPLIELSLDGFMTLTFRHLTDASYEFISSLGADNWAYGATQEEMTVFIRSFNVNVVEPAMA